MPVDPLTAYSAAKKAEESVTSLVRFFRWYASKRYPKAPRSKLGIAVAIFTDKSVEREQITLDFIDTLESQISNLDSPFVVIDIPPHLAVKIKTKEDAIQLLEKTRCVFLIFGKARLRNVNRQPTYVLDLKSVVLHRQIPDELSLRLSKEMSELLPGRGLISTDNDLFGFEINATLHHLAVRYIVATAALISGEFETARRFYKELRPHLNVKGDLPPFIKNSIKLMKERIPVNISVTHIAEARALHFKWRKDKDPAHLPLIKSHLDSAESYTPNFYDIWILKALYWFVSDRNIPLARKELLKCKLIPDPTWRLSEAFLFAYAGKLTEALRIYRTVMNRQPLPESSVLVEVEEFINWIIEEEPDKVQLHFCLGVINYLGKQDNEQAEIDFENFLRVPTNGSFTNERKIAKSYLAKIRSLGLSSL
jgi:tetratricopeptide (TPR) repeat protein